MSVATLAPTSAPTELAAYLEEVRVLVDRELDRRLKVAPGEADPGRLREAMHYAATGPGKRLRPAMLLAAAQACGGDQATALPAAAAVEMLHAYTLVHDDLPAMDDDDERRGRPTVHIAFGEAIAILAGDGLLTSAFGTLSELGARAGDAVRVLARRSGELELLGGQAIDLEIVQKKVGTAPTAPPTIPDLERLHSRKTGALFAAATELGGIAAGAPRATCEALGAYGMAIGIAFQHADDRDDAEFAALADAAAARMRVLCADALAIAGQFGPAGHHLAAIASWIAARA